MNDSQNTSFIANFIAGGLAGTIGAAVTCPLEVVKTRLQSSIYTTSSNTTGIYSVKYHVNGVISLLVDIKRKEGIRALWKGLGPTLVGVVPARSIYFGVYNHGKHIYTKFNNGIENSSIHLISAATAGVCTSIVTNPIWLIKTRLQLQSNSNTSRSRYRNSWHCFTDILSKEGIRGLYRGLSASMVGLSESTFQFVMYEYFKSKWGEVKNKDANSSPKLSWIETTVVASTAKFIAAVSTYPHEVIRTRLREVPLDGKRIYTGFIQTGNLIYKQEGVAALYGGMTAHVMRVVPNAAILFLSYEVLISLFS